MAVPQLVTPTGAFYVLIAVALFFLRQALYQTDTPYIKNLSQIPGWPLVGSLVQLGDTHAKTFGTWAKKYGPVFQVRLGNKRVVVANTFESVKQLWIHNQSALVSRPTYHTFHSVVSSSQGFTIGTSPWDESLKLRRKVAASALNRPAVETYMPIVDLETNLIVKDLFKDSRSAKGQELNPRGYICRFALNTSLTLNYGLRIGGTIDDELLNEVVIVEREIGNLRSTSHNWQDYVPLLRILPNSDNNAKEMRARRDKYLTYLLGELRKRITEGTDKPCITGNILKDPEAKLTEAEVRSLCITMVAGGLDTLPGNIIMTIGYWSSPHGQEIQRRAYEEIKRVYPGDDAYEKCLEGEKVPYIVAMVKEALRFWSAFQISLPRTSIKPIKYQDATIPAGTIFYMNSWAANYDDSHFIDPYTFNPERYLKVPNDSSTGTPHYGFGAGSRMCIGSHLANREIYTIFTRLILSFTFHPATDSADFPILDALECGAIKTAMALQPKPFKVQVRPRNPEVLSGWIKASDEKTIDCL